MEKLAIIIITIIILLLPIVGLIKFIKTKREFFLIPWFIYISIYYLSSYAGSLNFMLSYTAVKIAFMGLILSFIVLIFLKKLYFSIIIILLVVFRITVIPLLLVYFESYITTIALKKYPDATHYYFRGIDLDINEKIRMKHATFLKDGKYYHWSFKANDFVRSK